MGRGLRVARGRRLALGCCAGGAEAARGWGGNAARRGRSCSAARAGRRQKPRAGRLCVPLQEIRQLCLTAKEIFMSQPNLLELEAPIKICGV